MQFFIRAAKVNGSPEKGLQVKLIDKGWWQVGNLYLTSFQLLLLQHIDFDKSPHEVSFKNGTPRDGILFAPLNKKSFTILVKLEEGQLHWIENTLVAAHSEAHQKALAKKIEDERPSGLILL
jgi:hypothetical protein